MSNAYLIELNDVAVGLLARDESAYRFHAVLPRFNPLHGQVFADPAQATKAARQLAKQKRTYAKAA